MGAYSVDANGKSNAGFVIGLDTNHTFFKRIIDADDALRHLVKVRYSGNRQENYFSDYFEDDSSIELIVDTLYTKSPKWSYEEEWRMIIINKTNKDVIGVENIPIEMIKNVYLGVKANDDLISTALQFCANNSIELYKMTETPDGILQQKRIQG